MNQPLIFISYSHKDEEEKEKLLAHLGVLQRTGDINLWNNDCIEAGAVREQEISQAMERAKIAILLVSANFLASDFINRQEVPRLLERRSNEDLAVFPVIAKACAWRQVEWLARLNVRPKNGRPVWGGGSNRVDEDLAAIAEEVAGLIKQTPAPVPLEPIKGETVKRGFAALSELMQEDDEAFRSVVAFRFLFEAACQQIDVLGGYKNLHDLLHKLQFQCYDSLVQEARSFPDDERARENLGEYEWRLQSIIEELREAVAQQSFAESEMRWIERDLEPARASLRLALAAPDDAGIKHLQRAIRGINHVLATQPSRINTRLNQTARALRLPELTEAMKAVCGELRRLSLTSDKVRQFEEGVAALCALNQRLIALVNDHDQWQEVDTELRLIEPVPAQSLIEPGLSQYLTDLEFPWSRLKERMQSLCNGYSESWALAFKAQTEKLDCAIAAQNAERARQCLRLYRRQAGDRFFKVDLTLKRQCEELREAGQPLASVLRLVA